VEPVGPLPRDREGADATAREAPDRAASGGVPQRLHALDLGHDLVEQEAGVLVGEGVVLE
jgi:hypothetical protein